jgi:[acyl-carrier-protein] S-malonyltransferase
MVLLKEAGAKRVVALPVGGAFHSPLMAEAGRTFSEALANTSFENAMIPVVMNVDAKPETSGHAIREKLSRQMVSAVQWRASMATLVEAFSITGVI